MSVVEIFQVVSAITAIVLILLQNRSSGAGGAFGGGGGGVDFLKQRRGVEKYLFVATVILVVIFAALSVLNLVLQN